MSWPDKKHGQLLSIIIDVKSQILRSEDKDSRSYNYEEGVLLSANQAQILLDTIEDLANQLKYKL